MGRTVLCIDTSDRDVAIVKLDINGKIFEESSNRGKSKSQVTLVLISQVLKKAGIALSDIDTIKVKRGPGSYTGLRVGVSVANALAFALQLGVNDKELGVIEDAIYE